MLQLFWVILSMALAIDSIQTKVLTEEVEVAFSGQVNDNLSLLLGLDAFQKLDVDGNGFLSKQEIKPFTSHYLELAAQPFAESGHLGKIVWRDDFLESVVVPDMGAFGSELNTKYCYLDYAFTETSASQIWTQAFGEVNYVSVDEFVEKTFEKFQSEIKAPAQKVMENIKKSKSNNRPKVSFVKLDEYLQIRNPACESRRKLFFDSFYGYFDMIAGPYILGGWVDSTFCNQWWAMTFSSYCGYSSYFNDMYTVLEPVVETVVEETVEETVEDIEKVLEVLPIPVPTFPTLPDLGDLCSFLC